MRACASATDVVSKSRHAATTPAPTEGRASGDPRSTTSDRASRRRVHGADGSPRVGRHRRVGCDDAGSGPGAWRRPEPGWDTPTATWPAAPSSGRFSRRGRGPRRDVGHVDLGGDGARCRNLGRPGVASMAIAAVDTALWDLKARLLGLPLATLLDAVRDGGADLRQRRVHLLFGRALACAAGRLGRSRASPG